MFVNGIMPSLGEIKNMNRSDLEEIEKKLMALLVRRQQLGGFDVNAEAILALTDSLFQVVRHLRERASRLKKEEEN